MYTILKHNGYIKKMNFNTHVSSLITNYLTVV